MAYGTASFQSLRNGGRFSMLEGRGSTDYIRVSVRPHSNVDDAIIVKYLNNSDRGTIMAIYEDQIARGIYRFYKIAPTTIQHVPSVDRPMFSPRLSSKLVYEIIALLYAFVIYKKITLWLVD